MVKNPNWQEADQLAIYKRVKGVELRATEKQLQLAVGAGLEPGTSRTSRTSLHSARNEGFTLFVVKFLNVANSNFAIKGLDSRRH